MKTIPFSRFLLALFFGGLLLQPLAADPASDAAARIKDRLSQIDDMKAAGQVGEDVKGFLSVRGDLGPRQASIVEAENADRRILYQSVAQRTGQTVAEVGQQRALQIAARARSGVWLQKPDGSWFRKP